MSRHRLSVRLHASLSALVPRPRPSGASVGKHVASLHELGFNGAQALQDALGVPAAEPTARSDAANADEASPPPRPRYRAAPGETIQGEMVAKRIELAQTFAARSSDVPLLVMTEHSARGIDFKNIDVVFMLGLPARVESYVHIAGRTAREGRKGRAVCLLTDDDEFERLGSFGAKLGISIETVDVRFLGKR